MALFLVLGLSKIQPQLSLAELSLLQTPLSQQHANEVEVFPGLVVVVSDSHLSMAFEATLMLLQFPFAAKLVQLGPASVHATV